MTALNARSRRYTALRAVRTLLISTGLAASLPAFAADTATGSADDTGTGTTAAPGSSCARPAVMFNRGKKTGACWPIRASIRRRSIR
ncbi:hypothetical protein BSU04_37195 [Caballeronia sordidicola]|uniref:Uncharacterized protein n=1 Tax=Caballeronia sordidicola TaxID=196367 RepID=A0A226WQC1_CABSO|nr:hypothetical protein BSU04_37195 [Caballeronia sordidicola]